MGTGLVVHEHKAVAVDWSREMEGAKMLLSSGLLPQSIKTPQQALYIILTGRDLGLSPVQSLRSINVIQGKIEVAADMQLALFKRHGGRATFRALTADRAELALTHPNGDSHVESFTMEDAKRAGLGGDNWRKYPKAMLRSRVITAGLKSVGFDILAGAYGEGEIGGPEPHVVEDAPAVQCDADGVVIETPALPAPVEAASEPEPPVAPRNDAFAPTDKQVTFYRRLAESPVFTEVERKRALEWLATKATRQSIKDQIDWLKKQVETRKQPGYAEAAKARDVFDAAASATAPDFTQVPPALEDGDPGPELPW